MILRLYFDEDSMDKALVRALRSRGADVLTALEAGMIAKSDEAHLAFASTRGCALCSFNVADFWRLHTLCLHEGRHHGGIVLSRQQQYSVRDQMRRLLRLIAEVRAEEMKDRVEFLRSWG
mgnify:CR=1 FL=1